MNSYRTLATRITALACLATLLGGCNDSDRIDECLEYYHAPLIQAICMATEEAPAAPVGTAKDSGVTEYEPNDVLDNANVLSISDLSIAGSVQRGLDGSDFYIFTPPTSGSYRISVCEGACDGTAQSDAIYIIVYDQSQTTIAGTPIGVIEEQEVAAELTAGMAYYIEVNGYNTHAFAYSYRLTINTG
ncbi:MAG TPA: hypothetical protein VLA11_00370 [Woeseiaceae bacterium]|jgi:hypothetical protein|nr:hypothetical protein [Woeseiaceae bacterium]